MTLFQAVSQAGLPDASTVIESLTALLVALLAWVGRKIVGMTTETRTMTTETRDTVRQLYTALYGLPSPAPPNGMKRDVDGLKDDMQKVTRDLGEHRQEVRDWKEDVSERLAKSGSETHVLLNDVLKALADKKPTRRKA